MGELTLGDGAHGASATTRFRVATEEMQQTTKWLVAVVAGAGSFLLTALGFTGFPKSLGSGSLVALAGTVLVLLSMAAVVRAAARVLATPYETLRDLSIAADRRLPEAEALKPEDHRTEDPRVAALESQDDLLYQGLALNHRELFKNFRTANEDLHTASQAGKSEREMEALQHRVNGLAEATERVADFLDYESTRTRFQVMFRWLLGGLIAAAVGTVFLVRAEDRTPTVISRPFAVQVFLKHPRPNLFGCTDVVLRGVAVDGDWTSPQVVFPTTLSCKASRLQVTEPMGIVVPTP